MATHFSILAWRIPQTEEPGGPQSTGKQSQTQPKRLSTHTWEEVKVKVSQSCPILCNPLDRNLPGSSVCGILQADILEWVAMPSSRGSS